MIHYTAVIFDLDGTLLDTLEDLTDAVNFALQHNGIPAQTKDTIRMALGNGLLNLFETLLPNGHNNPYLAKCLSDFRRIYPDISQNHTSPYEGVPEMLAELQQNGIFTAVVSNKFHTAAARLVKHYFPSIPCCMGEQESAGIRRKPAPDMILTILQEYNIHPENCLYVGDSEVDIETAANAGIACVSVPWGFRDREFLIQHGASIMIHTPDALAQYILAPNKQGASR